jgi:peroxiredoxin/uncharacterized membrane protein YphA (DoxX/SURF4 family)
MDALLVALRLGAAVVLLAAGLPKLFDRQGLREAAEALGVPAALAVAAGVVLAPLEVVLALGLIVGVTAWWAALGALVLFVAFTAMLVANLARGRRPACHCFGQASAEPISWWSVVRNGVVLVALAVVVLADPMDAGPGVVAWADAELRDSATVRATVTALGLVAVTQSVAIALLLRRAANAFADDPHDHGAAGLAVGTTAPHFSVKTLDGRRVTLSDLLVHGRRVLLVFTDPGCGPCNALMPEVAEWQEGAGEAVTVAVIASGSAEDNRAKAEEHGIDVFLQKGTEVATAYRYQGTPGAVVIEADGTIGSDVAAGAPAIKQLLSTAAPGVVAPLVVGDAAPPLHLPALDGADVDLYEFAGGLTVVLFWSPTCGFCSSMLRDLHALEDRLREVEGVDLLIVSDGSAVANRRQRLRSTVVLDEEGRPVMNSFGADGTPMAVLVDAELRIASELATGSEEVLALADRAIGLARVAEMLGKTSPVELRTSGGGR